LVALGVLAALLVLSSSAGAGPAPQSYLIAAKGSAQSAGFKAKVAAAGGTITNVIDGDIAVVSSANADFKTKAASLGEVARNARMQWIPPAREVAGPSTNFANPPTSGDDDFFFDLQWGHDAIDSVGAWNAGYRGAGARVAVLDTGFDLDHPDLAPNINMALSKDFTGEGLQYSLPDPFSHGTHTAGIVAAADNGFGVIGVAPQAELVLVKVLGDEGEGTFEDVLEGISYAASVDADVISMSFGALFTRDDPDLEPLKHMMYRVTNKDRCSLPLPGTMPSTGITRTTWTCRRTRRRSSRSRRPHRSAGRRIRGTRSSTTRRAIRTSGARRSGSPRRAVTSCTRGTRTAPSRP
jgi:hypothetical protein